MSDNSKEDLAEILISAVADTYQAAGFSKAEALADIAQDFGSDQSVNDTVTSMFNNAWDK